MTAEVAILNRSAVAIAADSAVTVTQRTGKGPKVYNTANKLFALSATEPVAVMVYGAGAFGSIPWETVVKTYRMRPTVELSTVEEHATSFIDYLDSLKRHITLEEQQTHVLGMVFRELHMLKGAAKQEMLQTSDAKQEKMLLDLMASRIEELNTLGSEERLSESEAECQLDTVIDNWAGFLGEALDGFSITDHILSQAKTMVRTSLQIVDESPASTGVVIAGFGADQIFPALSHYVVDGVIADVVRVRHVGSVEIGEPRTASIISFAQSDMVSTFMDGIHPEYRLAINGFIQEIVNLLGQYFVGKLDGLVPANAQHDLMEEMKQVGSRIVEQAQGQFEDFEHQQSEPITSIVELLPKEEMAEMAEALVNLTSLKRRVTPEMETVGGPVDVLVISKGDGLIWLKRKHYFTPDLNFRYFERDRRIHSTLRKEV